MSAINEDSSISNERFGFTLFVSICAHVVLVLGVGFSLYERFANQPSLEITLAQYRSEEEPEEADFLAQENQRGSGELDEAAAPSTPVQSAFLDNQIEDVSPFKTPAGNLDTQVSKQVLSTQAQSSHQVMDNITQTERPDQRPLEEMSPAELQASIASLQAQLDLQRQAYAKRPRKYTISSASTKRHRDALYLDSWRKKIEAVGNLNYPEQASRQRIYGSLRLLVAIRPNGSVSEIRVLNSSGHKILDDAAINIVRLAAPFEAFPENMSREVDILEIIRTWQFHNTNSFSSF